MRKLLTILTSIVFCLALSLGLVACKIKDSSSSAPPPKVDYYVITVVTLDQAPVANATVNLHQSSAVFKSGKTDASGKASIAAPAGEYTVSVSNMPLGYSQISQACVTDTKFTPMTVVVNQGVPQNVTAPAGHHYSIGNVLYDFSVDTFTGEGAEKGSFVLSEVLKDKKMVLINFWATWCRYCINEFPAMNSAYEKYADDVAVIALSTTDKAKAVEEFVKDNMLSFPMAPDTAGIFSMMAPAGSTSIPVSVIVDRYGIMSFYHTGAMTEEKDFTKLFDKYISDDYVPENAPITGGGNNNDQDVVLEYSKPTAGLVMPESSVIENAINNTQSGFTFSYYEEQGEDKEFTWPWLVSSDGQSIYPSNIGNHYSFATIYADIELQAGDVLAFDYMLKSEAIWDVLYVQVNGLITHELSGNHGDTFRSCYAYVAERAGTYTLDLLYYKDTETHANDETVLIKNMRICTIDDIDAPTDIRRFAADFPVENRPAESKEPRYQRYAEVGLNQEDGYYHVLAEDGSPTGPLLMADLMYSTHWSQNSVYQFSYEGLCIFNNFDFTDLFETYAWIANNSDTKFAPVTEELQIMLEMLTEKYGIGYENEWLEICVYYDHFGGGEPIKDPAYGVHFKTAIPVEIPNGETSVTFDVNISKVLIPRGYRYSFTPTVSGVYTLKSNVPLSKSQSCDPIGWVFDSEYHELAVNDGLIGAYYEDGETYDNNFSITRYYYAGETYYFACADFDIYFEGSYSVTLTYEGESIQYFTNCAVGPYTYDEVTLEVFVPGALNVGIDDDGFVRELLFDNSFGSYIYLNVLTETAVLPSESIYEIVANGGFDFSNRQKPNGTYYPDYTDKMIEYINESSSNEGELYGFVKVDAELLDILKVFTTSGKFIIAEDTWQMMCYYYQTLDEFSFA